MVAILIRPQPETDGGGETAENDGDGRDGSDSAASEVEACEVETFGYNDFFPLKIQGI